MSREPRVNLCPLCRLARAAAVLTVASVLASCQRPKAVQQPASQPTSAELPPVPLSAPDSFPESLIHSLGVIKGGHGAPWVRRIIDVSFLDGTPLDQRIAAIGAVNGKVVGGDHWPIGEGDYFVLVPDSTLKTMVAAMDKLGSMPGVDYAGPFVLNEDMNAGIQRSHRR